MRLDRREIRAIERVLKSGRLRAGPVVEDFEARFARAVGARYAMAVNSGTAALYLAYRALLNPGDEIIVLDFTLVATASMAVGAKPVFGDVDPETSTLDSAALRRRRRNAALLIRGLSGIPGVALPQLREGATHAFNLFTIRLAPEILGMSRDMFQKGLARRGIETAVHYPLPLHRQPIFRGCADDQDFPVSTRLAKTVLSIPVHPGLGRSEIRRIVLAVREVAGMGVRA